MRSRKAFDPETDPPPDLAIEVDITSSSLDRMGIYAGLGVPEVWRFNGDTFAINLLRDGEYQAAPSGAALPALTVEVVSRFLALSDRMGETDLMRAFLDWVRAEVRGGAEPRKARRKRKK